MRSRMASILVMLGMGALAGSCGDSPNTPSSTADVTIRIVDNAGNMSFSPEVANVSVGQTVAFVNDDDLTHEIASDTAGVFDVGTLAPGRVSTSFVIINSGTVRYHCEIHPAMVGTLNVTSF
jgi:plastocyanin